MKYTVLLFSVLIFQGCIVSNRVSSIGIQMDEIYQMVTDDKNVQVVEVKRYDAYVPYEDLVAFPRYNGYDRVRNPSSVTSGELLLDSISTNNCVCVNVDGHLMQFTVINPSKKWPPSKGDQIMLRQYHRKWYGYPAQILLIPALPIDIVLDLLYWPFYLL